MFTRQLGRSEVQVSAIGLGCWAIGGPWTWAGGREMGWGQVDDAESIRAIHRSLDLGINLFDTAANYGAGHSERVLGKALAGRRDQVVIATKFGHVIDEQTRVVYDDDDVLLGNISQDCENSLRRLNTDYIDIYQLHAGAYDSERAVKVLQVLDQLVSAGKIRYYGWSTNDPDRARVFAQGRHCAAIQHTMYVFHPSDDILEVCREHNVGSICRSPLGSGVLTGKYTKDSMVTDPQRWLSRVDFSREEELDMLDAVRDVLTSDGRTMAQGALGWIWARSELSIPIPGFRTVEQVEENARAIEYGPLTNAQMQQIDSLLDHTRKAL